jgi:hypothetical protein
MLPRPGAAALGGHGELGTSEQRPALDVAARGRAVSLRRRLRRIRRWLRHQVPLYPRRWQIILIVAAVVVLFVYALWVG